MRMNRQTNAEPHRDPRFSDLYRAESVRMCRPPSHAQPPELPPSRDAAVILPLLLLLMTEGADRYLLLALLYILM